MLFSEVFVDHWSYTKTEEYVMSGEQLYAFLSTKGPAFTILFLTKVLYFRRVFHQLFDTLINAHYKSIRTGIIKKKDFLIIMSIYFIISWVHVVHVIQRKKNENKNDFTIDFFNLTRHFLLTQMKIKAALETISQQIIQNQQK